MSRQCEYVKPSGVRCGAPALRGGRFCVFHSRATKAKMAAASRRGGQNRKTPATTLPLDTPPLRLESVADVRAALAETFNLVRVGRMGVNVGNALGQLGGQLLKALQQGDLEQRIAALEAAAGHQPHRLNGRAR